MIEFDAAKDEINRAKHGISLEAADRMDLSAAIIRSDERFAYGEDRFQALAPIGGRLHVLVDTVRGETMRAISLRKANDRERKYYEQNT